MDELREKIAKILAKDTRMDYRDVELGFLEDADQILTLFKARVKEKIGELKVIGEEEIASARFQAACSKGYDGADYAIDRVAEKVAQAQLKDSKDRLLEEMK